MDISKIFDPLLKYIDDARQCQITIREQLHFRIITDEQKIRLLELRIAECAKMIKIMDNKLRIRRTRYIVYARIKNTT